jgi:hypothetical protein
VELALGVHLLPSWSLVVLGRSCPEKQKDPPSGQEVCASGAADALGDDDGGAHAGQHDTRSAR